MRLRQSWAAAADCAQEDWAAGKGRRDWAELPTAALAEAFSFFFFLSFFPILFSKAFSKKNFEHK